MRKETLTVLITGANSGIGKAVREKFLSENHVVYGIDLVEGENIFSADVTCENSLLKIKEEFIQKGIKFDLILNFAGIHIMASFLEEDFSKIKRLFEINLLGTILVNKTFYPLLTKKGKILVTSSEVASFDPLPFNGVYSVSKTAIDSYAQVLRQELNLLGQKVITLRPGAVETSLSKGSLTATEKLVEKTVLFKNESKHFLTITKKFMGKPITTTKLANFVYKISTKKRPKPIYSIHRNFGLVLLSILPKSWQCSIVKMLLKRK